MGDSRCVKAVEKDPFVTTSDASLGADYIRIVFGDEEERVIAKDDRIAGADAGRAGDLFAVQDCAVFGSNIVNFDVAIRVNDESAMAARDVFVFDDDAIIGEPTDAVDADEERVKLFAILEPEVRRAARHQRRGIARHARKIDILRRQRTRKRTSATGSLELEPCLSIRVPAREIAQVDAIQLRVAHGDLAG